MFLIRPVHRIAARRHLTRIFKKFLSRPDSRFSRYFHHSPGLTSRGCLAMRHRRAASRVFSAAVNRLFTLFRFCCFVVEVSELKPHQPYFALIKTYSGLLTYIPLIQDFFIGSICRRHFKISNFFKRARRGYLCQLQYYKAGDKLSFFFHNHFYSSFYARSAGLFINILYKSYCQTFLMVKLPSGLLKKIPTFFLGFFGALSKIHHKKINYSSASKRRLLGYRPVTRGIAKNPVDHPHGGRANTVQPERSPWGWIAKHKH